MRQSRFSEEQIIGLLREQEAGAATADVCRKHGISSATFYKWKAKYGDLDVSDAKRLHDHYIRAVQRLLRIAGTAVALGIAATGTAATQAAAQQKVSQAE